MFAFLYDLFNAGLVFGGVALGAVVGGDKHTNVDNSTRTHTDNSDRRTVHITYVQAPPGTTVHVHGSGAAVNTSDTMASAPTRLLNSQPRLKAIEGPPPSPIATFRNYLRNFHLPDYLREQTQSPLKITAAATGGTAFSLWYFFTGARRLMRDKRQWCNWKEEINTEDLHSIENLETPLIMDIQRRYTTTKYANDFVQPLKTFISTIDSEQAIITWYSRLGNVTYALCLGKVFGVSESSLEEAEDRLQRLRALRERFINWSTGLKITKKSHSLTTAPTTNSSQKSQT